MTALIFLVLALLVWPRVHAGAACAGRLGVTHPGDGAEVDLAGGADPVPECDVTALCDEVDRLRAEVPRRIGGRP